LRWTARRSGRSWCGSTKTESSSRRSHSLAIPIGRVPWLASRRSDQSRSTSLVAGSWPMSATQLC
jgi:hypothetical protein